MGSVTLLIMLLTFAYTKSMSLTLLILFLRDGQWQSQQLVSKDWIAQARSGGSANAEYGFANWFLNPGRKALPNAPESAVTFQGAGRNVIYIDKDNDLLIVTRWIGNGDELNQLVGKVLAALPQ